MLFATRLIRSRGTKSQSSVAEKMMALINDTGSGTLHKFHVS
jgi:hypothetical protein